MLTDAKGWVLGAVADGSVGIEDAPSDNIAYVRKNGQWVEAEGEVKPPDPGTGELTGLYVTRTDQPGTFEQVYGKKIFRDLISFDSSTASTTTWDRDVFIDFPSNISLFNGGTQGQAKYQFLILRDRRANSSTDKNGIYLGFEDQGSTSPARVGIKCVPSTALDVYGNVHTNNVYVRPNGSPG